MCGSALRGEGREIFVEGALVRVCDRCFSRATRKRPLPESRAPRPTPRSVRPVERRRADLEVVENYAYLVRTAREKLGLTAAELAARIKEKESVVKRVESGRLRPTIELARKLERALGVKLLEKTSEGEEAARNDEIEIDVAVTLGELIGAGFNKKQPARE
ncbi:MAG: multiprotein bridging factor aMBF1 [Fervidicoccaceae archaeon]